VIPAPLRKFVFDLIEATNEGKLVWKEGASDAFFCNHKTYSLHLNYHFNEDIEVGSYYMTIGQGGKDARFSVSDNEGLDDILTMRNLYQAVTLNASGLQDIGDDFFD
jgi:hypothetical protein